MGPHAERLETLRSGKRVFAYGGDLWAVPFLIYIWKENAIKENMAPKRKRKMIYVASPMLSPSREKAHTSSKKAQGWE